MNIIHFPSFAFGKIDKFIFDSELTFGRILVYFT